MNETERYPWSPLAYVVRTAGLPECGLTVSRSKYTVSLVESFGDDRLDECMGERDREFLACNFRVCSLCSSGKVHFGNGKASVIKYFFCDLAFSRIRSYRL